MHAYTCYGCTDEHLEEDVLHPEEDAADEEQKHTPKGRVFVSQYCILLYCW